jgi:hypothetical protein
MTSGGAPTSISRRLLIEAPLTVPARLADAEAAQTFRLLLDDLHAVDNGAARALSAEADERVDRVRLTLEHGLDGPVRAV